MNEEEIKLYVEINSQKTIIDFKSDELEALHSAHSDLNKQYTNTKTTLNNTRNSLKKTDSEVIKLMTEIKALKKSNFKMRGKTQKQGAKVLRLENELRRTDSDKWNKYKEECK